MMSYERTRARIRTQQDVHENRLRRRFGKLQTDQVLDIYEEGSNMYFHGDTLRTRAKGAAILSAAVDTLEARYEAVKSLDLLQPFPLRDWLNGIPQGVP